MARVKYRNVNPRRLTRSEVNEIYEDLSKWALIPFALTPFLPKTNTAGLGENASRNMTVDEGRP